MTIRCQCTSCSARFDAPDALAGKAVRCPKCKAAIRLPGAESKPSPAAKSENTAQVTPEGGASPEPSWFVRDTDGRHRGPMSKVELDRLVTTEQLDGLCQIRRADWEDWRWIETVYQQFAESDTDNVPVAADDFVETDLTVAAGSRLEECPDCGKIVSRRATQCPNCGCPIAMAASFKPRKVETTEYHGPRRGRMVKAIFLTGLLSALTLLLSGSVYLCWQLWQRANRPVEIILPTRPPQAAPVAPPEPTPEQPATPQ